VSVDVDSVTDAGSARALVEAERLAADGALLEAIDVLQFSDYDRRDPLVDIRLAELRRDAYAVLDRAPGSSPWPPDFTDPFPGETGLIELPRAEATPEVVGGAIRHHGCILVRGMLDREVAEGLVPGIEAAFTGLEAANQGTPPSETAPWYVPLASNPEFPPDQTDERANLRWFRVCTMDSPRAMFEVIAAYEAAGIGDIVRRYLGARPVMSASKWALRRMPKRKLAGWHQEANVFPRVPIHTMNVWLTLTPCGEDSPSLDVVPRRETEVFPLDNGFMIPAERFEQVAAGAPKVSPRYDPGDAMIFDEMLIHRTNTDPAMDGLRYSIESWFFAPAGHPTELGPVVF
jgi:ectoine hydroxylase-related dioxygenase (phytanoyl-CoA dioxygenase family)